jgi:predicted nucleic acid-binding protein
VILVDTSVWVDHFRAGDQALAGLLEAGKVLSHPFVDWHRLFGSGIGYVDAHLLAAVRLTAGAALWTRDRRLGRAADRLGLAISPLG